MTVDEFASAKPAVVLKIALWDAERSLSLCAGLLLCPEMHGHTFGLEVLIHVICVHSTGMLSMTVEDIMEVLDSLSSFLEEADEFPRDLFVVNVMTEEGNRRFLTGTWETPEFWVQQSLDTLRLAPDGEPFDRLRAQVRAILRFSEAAMDRNGLLRYATSLVRPEGATRLPDEQKIKTAVDTVRVLASLEVDLEDFVLSRDQARKLGPQRFGSTTLEERPFIRISKSLVIWALPTATATAVRMLLVRKMQASGNLKGFSRTLGSIQAGLFYEDLLDARTRSRFDKNVMPLPSDLNWMRQAAVEFDGGKIAHAMLLRDDLEDLADRGITSFNSSAMYAAPISQLHLSRSSIRLSFGLHRRGLTVIVMAGLGRPFLLPRIATPANWYVCAIHLSDALALKFLDPDWLSFIWRVKHDIDSLAQVGLDVRDTGDDIRALGYWRAKQRIVPLDAQIPTEGVEISIDRTFAGSLRAEARIGYDEHASYKPSKRSWFRVAKLQGLAHFDELRALPMYGSLADARNHELSGVVETRRRSWWVDLQSTGNANSEIAYMLWDSTMQWCGRILPLLEEHADGLSDQNIEIHIDADFPALDDIIQIPKSENFTATTVDPSTYSITVLLSRSFFAALAEPTNRAEKGLVMAIMEGIAAMNGGPLPTASDLLGTVFENPQARFMHLFVARNIADEIRSIPSGRPLLLTDQDSYDACRGVGSALGFPGLNKVAGKQQCQSFLHEAVDLLCDRINALLRTFDRVSLIQAVLRNIDSVLSEDVRWQHTAAALLSVYRDQHNIIEAAHAQSSARARTMLSSRVLLEMAICECPSQRGLVPGLSDYASLMGLISALILAAYNSDAIVYDLVQPSLDIWPNGEFEISRGFFETILQPYQQGRFRDQFQKSAVDYEGLFVEQDQKTPGEVFDAEFLSAWESEFGFTIVDLVKIEEALVGRAHSERSHVISISVEEFCSLLGSAGVDEQVIKQVLDTLVLWPRDSWTSLPQGLHIRDIEPWKFGRKLSLLRRPLLGLNRDRLPGNLLFYGAGLLHHAFSFTVTSAYSGLISEKYFASPEMRRWIGTVNHKNGNVFNEEVRTTIASVGLQARAAVKMSEFGVGHLGDIDVLAWTGDGGTVLVVECKQLRFARTIAEVGEQLQRFRGRPKDDLWAHLRRVEWLREHASALKKKLSLRDEFRMHQLLVTENLVPMAFVAGLPIPSETVVPANRLVLTVQKLVSIKTDG